MISPSDFIQGGESDIEARAKALFAMLREQRRMVVLFDEIDRLVLDRSRADYGHQSDMFQFMTPSMLTKLNDLREIEGVVFVIGTNYEERIDSAVKRAGRIDDNFLLLPPALDERGAIVSGFLRSQEYELRSTTADRIARLVAQETPLFTYTELRQICDSVRARAGDPRRLERDLLAAVSRFSNTITLESYRSRFPDNVGDTQDGGARSRNADGAGTHDPGAQSPVTEFLMLAYNVVETGASLPSAWVDAAVQYAVADVQQAGRQDLPSTIIQSLRRATTAS